MSDTSVGELMRTASRTALAETRARTLALVNGVSEADLERVHSRLLSPLVWDLGHIAAFEDLWLAHRTAGQELLRADLAEVYDAFETPRAGRGALPFLRHGDVRRYLEAVRKRTLLLLEDDGLADRAVELIIRHEQQHNETMLQTLQLARLGVLRPAGPKSVVVPDGSEPGLELVEVVGGSCQIGADPAVFSYDNERPRHRTDVRGYLIGRTPITNASFLRFVEGGGYERREWWTEEAWSWKEEYDITRPGGWSEDLSAEWRLGSLTPLHPLRPVVHVSWFEADAFARAHGLRLPTEVEWEKAATWDEAAGVAHRYPWGAEAPVTGAHANLDLWSDGPEPVSPDGAGRSPCGCAGMIGDVWEWTASTFTGYPGFAADPYREYSEVFFDSAFRVLRGGSWASRPRVTTPAFRNWDLPQRRQIFAGFRVAADAS